MSKLKCTCGYIIVDQTDNLEYKGYVFPDKELDNISEFLTDNIDSLIEAVKSGQRRNWIRKMFLKGYPTNLKESSMIHDLISSKLVNIKRDIFECENCGRIIIQIEKSNQFKFFSPDSEEPRGLLNSKK